MGRDYSATFLTSELYTSKLFADKVGKDKCTIISIRILIGVILKVISYDVSLI